MKLSILVARLLVNGGVAESFQVSSQLRLFSLLLLASCIAALVCVTRQSNGLPRQSTIKNKKE